MKCPSCNEIDLLMTERQGIEIDYCPKCRGVWLDRGELDKFIQQSERQASNYPIQDGREATMMGRPGVDYSANRESHSYNQYSGHRRDDDDEDHRYLPRGKKKESFLSKLFDFD